MKNLSLIIILGSAIIGLSLLLGMAHMDILDYKKYILDLETLADEREKLIDANIAADTDGSDIASRVTGSPGVGSYTLEGAECLGPRGVVLLPGCIRP